jgi:choline-sulfatase
MDSWINRRRMLPPAYWSCWLVICLVFHPRALSSTASEPAPVIVISVDTLRADRLSCYGNRRFQTTAIDSIAKGGTLLQQAVSQVPLTLPSHVSLLTSTYPFSNGIEDNGQVLAPGATTLASVLRSIGYATGAFVGGFALDRRFGLDQGFDSYDSPFDLNRQEGIDPSDLKRPAEEVTKMAETWLDGNATRPFFLFLHFYDLHTPYQLPANARARFGVPGYDAEVKYVNATLGHFLVYLRQKGIYDKALIVFLSDHGESLGEHGEATHGYFIYQSTLHVPLLFHFPEGAGPLRATVTAPISLLDVAPTVLDFLGIAMPAPFQGKSRLELFRTQVAIAGGAEVYSESLYAHNHYRCSPLRSVREGQYKYIEAPKPELYDLDHDPGELTNLYRSQQSIGLSMRRKLSTLLAAQPKTRPSSATALSPRVVEQLRALGYVAGSGAANQDPASGADPKDRVVQYEQTHHAIFLAYAGKLEEAVDMLQAVLAETPDLPDTRNILGTFQQKLGKDQQAAMNFRDVLREDPLNILAHYNLAMSYFRLNRLEDSVKELNAVLALASGTGDALQQVTIPARELLGTISMQQKDYALARTQFAELLTKSPRNYTANFNLGWLAGQAGNPAEGVQYLQTAVEVDPANADGFSELGTLYLALGDLSQAEAEFAQAVHLAPASPSVHYYLGVVLARQQDNERAANEFKLALQAAPGFRPAREALEHLQEAK